MLRRLPISLRFDDDDSDFYYGFIEQKKNDRELSTLILNLLHVYYENEEVRNIVNDYVISQSPYLRIHEQLERIALEHSRQTVSADMLSDFNDNARKKISEPPEPVKEDKPEEPVQQPLLLEEAMDKLQPLIDQKVAEAIGRMFMNNMASQDIAKSISVNVGESLKENTSVSAPTIPMTPAPTIPVTPTIPVAATIPTKPVVASPVVSEPVVSEPVVSIPKPASAPQSPSVESNNGDGGIKKPASFAKLVGSMK